MSNSRDTIYSYYKTHFPDRRKALSNGKFDAPTTGPVGHTCIRIQRPTKDFVGPSFEYKFSYSFCSPEDNFSKRVARAIADGRVQRKVEITIASDTRKNARELSEQAIEFITDAAQKAGLIGEPITIGNGVKVPRWLQNVNKEKTNPAGKRKTRK